MALIMSEPDSKLPEKANVSSSIYESPPKTSEHLNGNNASQTPILNELKSMGENNGIASNGIKSNSSSSTPPPLEPIPPSLFPGESAKIYSAMPPLMESSPRKNAENSETARNGEHSQKSFDTYVQMDQPSINQTIPAPSNGLAASSPQLMPPPLTNMMKMRANGYGTPNKIPQNGHFRPRYPDSSHDIYANPPGPSRYPYPGRGDYPHQSPYVNTNGNSQYYRYSKGPLRVTMPTSTAGQVHLVNGDIHHPQHIPRQGTSSNASMEDNGEIINVDEDVDLERMYLDLITEEYTATVKSLLPQLSIAKMDPMSQVFCLRWNNHRNNLLTVFDQLLQTEAFCDVTLACDNNSIKCHKMILCACSSYFQQLFMENTCEHPIVFLKDIKYEEIRTILDYMYKGEVNVAQEELPGLLKVAELLKVKGLVEEEREKLFKSQNRDSECGRNSRVSTSVVDDETRERSSSAASNKNNHGDENRSGSRRGMGIIPDRERERIKEREMALLERDLRKERESLRAAENERHSEATRATSDSRERNERSDVISRESAKGNGEGVSPTSNGEPRGERSNMPPWYAQSQGGLNLPMFPGMPGINPNIAAHFFRENLIRKDGHNGDRDHHVNDKEGSPSPQGSGKRRKVASGSGGSSSSKESGIATIVAGGNMGRDGNGEPHPPVDISQLDQEKFNSLPDAERENILAQLPPGIEKSRLADYVPNQRLEWKRYKQYTRTDIMAAIEEVKKGMSALQAARKYGVPSRTLYDKVKKMGITTGRQVQRKSLPQYQAAFPRGLGMMNMADHDAYKDMDDREDNSSDAYGNPGDIDGRATMVPPSGFSTLHMLNIMKEMKENDRGGKGDHGGEILGMRPMNLTTMLSNAGSRDMAHVVSKRNSDSSLSPRSPPGMDHDSRDEIVDPRIERDHDIDDDIAERDDMDRDRNHDGRRPGPDSSDGIRRGDRHPSGDTHLVRQQFMADLRRLGGNIPTQSSEGRTVGDADGSSDHQTATSTTVSPPPLSKNAHPPTNFSSPTATSPSKRSVSCEDNLPPRKRKVSQEHHLTQLSQDTVITINGQRSPNKYNGIHHNDGDSGGSTSPTPQAKSTGSSADSEGSTTPAGSPDKSSEHMIKEDNPSSSQTVE